MSNIRSVFSVARTEFVRWITNPRIIIVGILFVFMYTLAVEPLLERADKFGGSLSFLEPFVAIGNSGMLVMLLPCVFLVLISDYPKMCGNTLFMIFRCGRFRWLLGQFIFLIMAIITFLLSVFAAAVLVSNGSILLEWSDTVTKYEAAFPNETGNFTSQLLPSNLYNQIPLVRAVVQTLSLLGAYLLLLSLIIYFFKLVHTQSFGIFAAIFVVAAGVMTCSLKSDSMWLFPMANTIVWLHYEEILRKPIFPIWYSYVYFIIAIVLLLLINFIAAKRLQLTNIEQVE